MNKYDAIIIGFGKGGKTLATDLASHGQSVAVIEQSKMMYGGTCINVGCIPTKSLVNSSKLSEYKEIEGIKEKAEFYKQSIKDKDNLTSKLRTANYDQLNDHPNITVFTGKAAFVSSYEIKVELENESIILQGERIFINTGSKAIMPDIDGIANNKRVHTSESMLDVAELPERLSIIGGGYIGLEFASMFASFGSKVTVFLHKTSFLPNEDEDMANEVKKVLMEKGIEFKFGAVTKSVSDQGGEAVIHYVDTLSGEALDHPADAVLLATGRKPNTEYLNLAAAGIDVTPRGAVEVDEYLRTSKPNIWAMGDVTGGLQYTYVSLDDYRIVREQLFGKGERTTAHRNIPYSMFVDPVFSRVGLSEKEARDQGYDVKIAKLPAMAIPKAKVVKETKGLLKAVIDRQTKQILGAVLFCYESHEIINIVKLAMDTGLPYTYLRDQIFTHPTFCEALNTLFLAAE